jgi:hypothetical protein
MDDKVEPVIERLFLKADKYKKDNMHLFTSGDKHAVYGEIWSVIDDYDIIYYMDVFEGMIEYTDNSFDVISELLKTKDVSNAIMAAHILEKLKLKINENN